MIKKERGKVGKAEGAKLLPTQLAQTHPKNQETYPCCCSFFGVSIMKKEWKEKEEGSKLLQPNWLRYQKKSGNLPLIGPDKSLCSD
jgi:hypothetical protein